MANSKLNKLPNYDFKKLRQLKILLVEDDLLSAKLVSILFSQNGLKLEVAANGAAAVEKIKTSEYDIILMDMEMPVMNGYDATTVIRQQHKNNIPIIALTANALAGDREKCLQLGMNGYISKPVHADILFKTIHNLTDSIKSAGTKIRIIKTNNDPAVSVKVCDMGYLINATRGNKKIINKIVTVFFKETRKELVFLNDAIEKSNYTVIGDISHKIKSAFSILGISELEPVFKEMEQLSNSTSDIGKIEQLNYKVNTIFKQARAEMKASI